MNERSRRSVLFLAAAAAALSAGGIRAEADGEAGVDHPVHLQGTRLPANDPDYTARSAETPPADPTDDGYGSRQGEGGKTYDSNRFLSPSLTPDDVIVFHVHAACIAGSGKSTDTKGEKSPIQGSAWGSMHFTYHVTGDPARTTIYAANQITQTASWFLSGDGNNHVSLAGRAFDIKGGSHWFRFQTATHSHAGGSSATGGSASVRTSETNTEETSTGMEGGTHVNVSATDRDAQTTEHAQTDGTFSEERRTWEAGENVLGSTHSYGIVYDSKAGTSYEVRVSSSERASLWAKSLQEGKVSVASFENFNTENIVAASYTTSPPEGYPGTPGGDNADGPNTGGPGGGGGPNTGGPGGGSGGAPGSGSNPGGGGPGTGGSGGSGSGGSGGDGNGGPAVPPGPSGPTGPIDPSEPEHPAVPKTPPKSGGSGGSGGTTGGQTGGTSVGSGAGGGDDGGISFTPPDDGTEPADGPASGFGEGDGSDGFGGDTSPGVGGPVTGGANGGATGAAGGTTGSAGGGSAPQGPGVGTGSAPAGGSGGSSPVPGSDGAVPGLGSGLPGGVPGAGGQVR